MALNIFVFYNNQFNKTDIPADWRTLVNSSSSINFQAEELNSYSELERTLRVNTTSDCSGWNFVEINDRYASAGHSGGKFYTITDLHRENPETLTIHCVYNPIVSGRGNYMISGLVYRRTPTKGDNEEGGTYNMLPEPIIPSLRRNSSSIQTPEYNENLATDINFILSTINLSTVYGGSPVTNLMYPATKTVYQYDGEGKNIESTLKEIPHMEVSPSSVITRTTGASVEIKTHSYKTNGCGIYLADNNRVQESIKVLNNYGIPPSQYILARWSVPRYYCTYAENGHTPGFVSLLVGITPTTSATLKLPGTDCNNQKARYLNATITVYSPISGYSKSFRWCDLKLHNFKTFSNPGPNGKPYIYPSAGGLAEPESTMVPGGEWARPSMVVDGATGKYISDFETASALKNNKIQQTLTASRGAESIAKATMPIMKTAMGGGMFDVSPTADTASNIASLGRAVDEYVGAQATLINEYNTKKTVQEIRDSAYSPSYLPAELPELSMLYNNIFILHLETDSDTDMHKLDEFLTAYGWRCDEMITHLTLNSLRGAFFDYIQMSDCSVSNTGGVPGSEKLLKAMLDSGVRIWHNAAPTAGIYSKANV